MYPLYSLSNILSLGFTSDFQFMAIIILYLFTSCLTIYALFHQSPALILLSLLDIICYIYLPASVCLCLRHDFQCMFMIQIYWYTYAYLCTIWHSHHHSLGSYDSLRSSCPGLGAWSLWISPVVDQSGAAKAWIATNRLKPYSSRPPRVSRVFLL